MGIPPYNLLHVGQAFYRLGCKLIRGRSGTNRTKTIVAPTFDRFIFKQGAGIVISPSNLSNLIQFSDGLRALSIDPVLSKFVQSGNPPAADGSVAE